QIVFNSRNNTVYVLDVSGAAVDARDPGTNDLKTRIQVGGEPTALALNEVTNRVLVLDSSQKRVTEIDAASNTVVGATSVAVTGTPTSISVDPATNNIVVTTSTKSPAPGTSAGSVAVINSSTKELETVREFSVAPRLVVPDQQGHRSALVSSDQTQLVDSSYKILEILPGGVSAAFSKQSDNLAVLPPPAPVRGSRSPDSSHPTPSSSPALRQPLPLFPTAAIPCPSIPPGPGFPA